MAAGNKPSVKFVILSLEESSDLDNTAAKCLLALYKPLENNGQPLMLARVKGAVRDLLAHLVPNKLGRKKLCCGALKMPLRFQFRSNH